MNILRSFDSNNQDNYINKTNESSFDFLILQERYSNQLDFMDIENPMDNDYKDHLQTNTDQIQISPIQDQNEQTSKKRIKKDKNLKKVEYQLVPLNERCVPLIISSYVKHFQIAGGILLEVNNDNNVFDQNSMQNLKSIQKVQKNNNGSLSVGVLNRALIKQFDQIVYILESTQNYENYKVANMLRSFQQPISNINQTIERIKRSTENEQLIQIIKDRKQYYQQFKQNYIQQYLKEDEFSQMVTFQIDWSAETISISSLSFSKALIALIGTVNEEVIQFILRNGLFQLFNYNSKRKLFDANIAYYTHSLSRENNYFKIQDIELQTLDQIIVKCDSLVQTFEIQYPPHLQFQDDTNSNINNIEKISILKFDITQDQILKIINLRQSFINQKNKTDFDYLLNYNQDEDNNFMAQNFEYYVQSELFLQNFYKERYQEMTKKNIQKNKQPCSYRHINQSINQY